MKQVDKKTRSHKYGLLTFVAMMAATALILTGCMSPEKGAAEVTIEARSVKTEAVAKQVIGNPSEQVGDISAGSSLDIVSKANGEIMEVYKKRGEYAKKGDILFKIDSKNAESASRKNELTLKSSQQSLQKAKDDQVNNRRDLSDSVQKAETTLKNAQQDYNKLRNEYDSGLATERQLEQSNQLVDNARMSLESAQSKLAANDNTNTITSYETQAESARLALDDSIRALDDYSVKAPASGFLTDFTPQAGQTVSAATKLGQVQQVDPLVIKTELSEASVKLVTNKTELVYYNPEHPESKGTAKISYLAPIMSAQTKTYTLELEIPNPDQLIKPGSRVMVQLTTDVEQKVIVVPTLSIIREESNTFVFVQQGEQYEKRKVKLGRINGGNQEVLEGVKEGEQLVVVGQQQLKDGQKVGASTKTNDSDTPAATQPVK